MNKNTYFPKQMLPYLSEDSGALSFGRRNDPSRCANSFWVENWNGDSVHCVFNGNGWTIKMQQSYLCRVEKDGVMAHRFRFHKDINGFEHSHFPIDTLPENEWDHLWDTPELAIKAYVDYRHEI